MTTVAISVILSTYNAPAALAVSLQSFAQQQDRGFEVVVADDGSTRETADLVATAGRGFPVPLRHLWQDDIGFRLARARNLATAHSRGDYLLFVDGDCFVLPDFIACHRALAQRGHFVSGKRCWLRRPASRRCLAGGGAKPRPGAVVPACTGPAMHAAVRVPPPARRPLAPSPQ